MESPYLPQELIDIIISYIDDRETLASVRLVSPSCRRCADPLYFKKLFIILSTKSIDSVEGLIASPCGKYVEEIHWVDKDLSRGLEYDLEAFQETFKERLTDLPHQSVLELHQKYGHMLKDQQNAFFILYNYEERLNLKSFVNIKRVTVDNGCESRTEKHTVAPDVQETIKRPSQWGAMRQSRLGSLYPSLLKPLAASPTSRTVTHFSIRTQGFTWDDNAVGEFYFPAERGPLFMFKNIEHLEIDLCIWEIHLREQVAIVDRHLRNGRQARNLQSITFKTHPHHKDEKGVLGRPLTDPLHATWTRPTFLPLLPALYPQLRHLEFHGFTIHRRKIIECLDGLQHALESLVFNNCVFQVTLLMVFTSIRKMKLVPLETTFTHSKNYWHELAPEKPSIMTDEAITPYLVWQGMDHSLSLHTWDKQVKEYADQHSEGTKEA